MFALCLARRKKTEGQQIKKLFSVVPVVVHKITTNDNVVSGVVSGVVNTDATLLKHFYIIGGGFSDNLVNQCRALLPADLLDEIRRQRKISPKAEQRLVANITREQAKEYTKQEVWNGFACNYSMIYRWVL